jgi:TolB-like protein/tetratricopeptide (TPR) repeat protein
MSILSELRRRNVFRVAALYLVAGWVLLQVAELLFGALDVPAWSLRLLLGLLLLGLPLALIFAWAYELTPEGLKREHEVDRHASVTRETGHKLNVLIAGLLVVAIGLLAWGQLGIRKDRPAARGEAASAASAQAPAETPATRASALSIAVLPFVNMSDDRGNEYFSDGLTEELLNLLARIPELKVIARTSSFVYKGKEAKISDIARELQVANVLEGSVRKSGDRVRITAQLIRTSDSTHLWSQSYDRTVQDIFAVQDEIAGEVVDSLKVKLLGADHKPVQAGGTSDARAYEAYLRGKYEVNKGESQEFLRAALSAFDEALALDPSFAQAHAARSSVLQALSRNAYLPYAEGFVQAREAAERAIELAPDASDGYVALGRNVLNADGDWQRSEVSLRKALQLNPSNAAAYTTLANLLSGVGRVEEALAAARQAVSLDPLALQGMHTLASVNYDARRYDEARAIAHQIATLDPQRPRVHYLMGLIDLTVGEAKAASAACEKERVEWQRQTCLAIAYDKLGRAPEAAAQRAELRRTGDASAYQFAQISAQRGEPDEAIRWLEVARRVRDPGAFRAAVDPLLDPLREDPRFKSYLRELNLPGG